MQIRLNRFLAAVILGLLTGMQVYRTYVKWNHLGRAAFLEDQGRRFDTYMAVVYPLGRTLIGALVAVLGSVVVYELISFGLSRLFNPTPPETQHPQA